MKGQEKIEFLVSAFIFFSVVLIIGNYLSTKVHTVYSDDLLISEKMKAERIIDILVKEKGIPEEWENIGTPKRLGLAYSEYNLSWKKVKALKDNCEIFDKVYTNSYRITIYNITDGKDILVCGYKGNLRVISERTAILNNTPVRVVLELWL